MTVTLSTENLQGRHPLLVGIAAGVIAGGGILPPGGIAGVKRDSWKT